MSTEIEYQEEVSVLDKLEPTRNIILFNDDVNTFDHVIDSLVKHCKHKPLQAEQCAHIVHHNGKCDVKRGTLEDLKPICEKLAQKGLTVEIN